MSDDNYTRCGTILVYAGQLELQPEILAELGEAEKFGQVRRACQSLAR